MIDKLRHFILTAYTTVHDEEAMSSLELLGRIGGKVNEIIDEMNDQRGDIEKALDGIPAGILRELKELIENGSLKTIINDELLGSINARLGEVISSGNNAGNNPELVDMRVSSKGTVYAAAGNHLRDISTGKAFNDAVRPGTVNANRISDGMLMGDLAAHFRMMEYYATAGKWNSTGYVNAGESFITAHTGYAITDPMPCQYGDMFEVYSSIFGNKVYPAFILNASGAILGVTGSVGIGSWEQYKSTCVVDHPEATHIRFICGAGQTASFRALRYTARSGGDVVTARNAHGYIHAVTRRRSDTVTDRAQVKMYFPVEEGNTYSLAFSAVDHEECDFYTFRLFACYEANGYDVSLPESDHARPYSTDNGVKVFFTVPHSEIAVPFTHVCLFIDLLPNNPDSIMDVSILNPVLMKQGGQGAALVNVKPYGVSLHGAVDPDMVCHVAPNAYGSKLAGKVIIGMGDSLMSGNTLPKSDSWFNIACGRNDMLFYNHGLNGGPVATSEGEDDPESMYTRTMELLNGELVPDYFILEGGANDKRLNIDITKFKKAITLIIKGVRLRNPSCKILLMTNWKRTTTANAIALFDDDYVAAMIEVGEEIGVPVLNNYSAVGIDLTDDYQYRTFDEGYVKTLTKNLHFSRAANEFIADYFEEAIKRL